MYRKFGYIFMSIIVLGLIFNISSFSNFAFSDDSEDEKGKSNKEQKKQEREAAKEEREQQRKSDKEKRESIKEFEEGILATSSISSSADKETISSSTGKVTICHIPPGNVDSAHTITVGKPALRAHLAHGDVEESCDEADLSEIDENSNKELRLSENSEDKESKALERALKLIENLEEKISRLNDRLQHLMEKYESGEYFGNISSLDSEINSYSISFEGTAISIYDETVTTEMSGKFFMENQVTTSDTSKFNINSGEIIIGNNVYDIVFGKARASSSGQSGDEDSLVIVAQTIDSEGNDNTIKMTLGFGTLDGNIGDSDEEFEIMENSKVSQQWILEGAGELKIES